jgi:hypothetical protein
MSDEAALLSSVRKRLTGPGPTSGDLELADLRFQNRVIPILSNTGPDGVHS